MTLESSSNPGGGERVRFALCRTALTLVLLYPAFVVKAEDQSTLRSVGGGQPSVDEFSDGQTLIVFAHQDDDLLWMLPFWPVTKRFLLAAIQQRRCSTILSRAFRHN